MQKQKCSARVSPGLALNLKFNNNIHKSHLGTVTGDEPRELIGPDDLSSEIAFGSRPNCTPKVMPHNDECSLSLIHI